MPTPLPKVDSPEVQHIADKDPDNLSAYNICLNYEEELAAFKDKLCYVRILGFLLLHAPNRGVRSEVTKCIHSRKHWHSSDLADVGAFFERNVIVPCEFSICHLHSLHANLSSVLSSQEVQRSNAGTQRTPLKALLEVENDEMKVDITRAPKNHKDAKYHALTRDNWRCVVTGTLDRRVPEHIAQLDPTGDVVYTQCAHIIPESTYFGVQPKSKENNKLDYSASVLAVLKRFGYDIDSLNGKNVHSLTNVISMTSDVHEAFDRLELYFEATSLKDCYEVRWFGRKPFLGNVRELVQFSTWDPENLPVPARELLALHATCCKVAHLSGAAEYIDEISRDADELDVLSADGTSAAILDYLLLSLLKLQDSNPRLYEPASLMI
ncbi:hypothetical protein JVT61DRAFT_8949 [Boletus reticuloceps]|uniref:HNH nuclease domain-containing protein n=1 Tax=Boletus reticuloceps TaxID=495285 RepID=A0A8I2YIH7_9AGAM|nr:hypothetical protein JVT61DRAFT_8949 [Boletus reticuloceps]